MIQTWSQLDIPSSKCRTFCKYVNFALLSSTVVRKVKENPLILSTNFIIKPQKQACYVDSRLVCGQVEESTNPRL